MIKKYVSPDGVAIIGTLESIPAVALIEGIDTSTGDAIYTGDTKADMDCMSTVIDKRKRPIFVDANGRHWAQKHLSPEDGLHGAYGRRTNHHAFSKVLPGPADVDQVCTEVSVGEV